MDTRKSSCILKKDNGGLVVVIRPSFFKQMEGEYVIRCEILREIREEMIGLLNEGARAEGLPLWPPENADPWCSELAGAYYQEISRLLTPCFDPMELTQADRHTFFVCTGPEEVDGLHRLGLSRMEELMGFGVAPAQKEDVQESKVEGIPSTGKQSLDIIADVTLFFQKKGISDLFLALSPEELVLLTQRASTALDRAYKEAERKSKGQSDNPDDGGLKEKPIDVSEILGGDFSQIENLPQWLREE